LESIKIEVIIQWFPQVIRELSKSGGNSFIQLKEDAKPDTLTIPKRVAVPLLARVQTELQKMKTKIVITRVEEPTKGSTGMNGLLKPKD